MNVGRVYLAISLLYIPFSLAIHHFGEEAINIGRSILQKGVFSSKKGKHTLDSQFYQTTSKVAT